MVVLGAVLLAGCGGSDDRASRSSPPRERVLVEGDASGGGHYKLALRRTPEGTCWELIQPDGSGEACGLGLGKGDAFNVAQSGGPQREFIYGPVAQEVSRIEVKRGTRTLASTTPRREAGDALLFFFIELSPRQKGRLVVVAYDRHGREIDTFRDREPPGVDPGEPNPAG